MRGFERRETNAYPYFKLATWDAISLTWRAGKATLPTEAGAKAEARKRGRYRVEQFNKTGSLALEPFDI